MDINQLKYFISVAQTLNFSEAARRNGLTQPSISHHIGELEKHLGTQLFIRDKRSVTLTDAGRAFLPNAVEIVELAQKSVLQLEKLETGRTGHLTIAALTTSSPLLSQCITAFNSVCPDITVDIHFTSGRTQSIIMNENKYDFHFATEEMVPAGETFATMYLGSDRLCLAMPSGHPLVPSFQENGPDLSKLRKERFIAFSQNDGPAIYNQVMKVCAKRGYRPDIFCQHDRAEAILLSVGSGVGISVVPENLRQVSFCENVTFFPLEGADAVRNYVMAWRKSVVNPAVARFVEAVAPLFPQQP